MKRHRRWKRLFVLAAVGTLAVLLFWKHRDAGATAVSQDRDFHFKLAGRTRYYSIHLPRGYDGRYRLPVVLVLHGGGGDARVTRRQTQMDRVSDRFGFLAVYPEGTGILRHKLLTWNAGSCCGYAVKKQIDDVGFIAAVLDDLNRRLPIDSKRVYATGMSNGAMMCYRLACELFDRIAAIAPVSGTMGVDGPRPPRAMPILLFHGLMDRNAPFRGGVGANAISNVAHRSVPDTVAWWCRVNGCDGGHPHVMRGSELVLKTYTPPGKSFEQAPAPIVLYELLEGGHTWPGGVDVTPRLNTGKLVQSVDASTIMWEFFRQFTTDGRAPVAEQ